MILARTNAPDQTRDLAAAVATLARAGDLVLLVGDLGAGKTAFSQGFAMALGVTEPVTSPTFTLANRYEGRLQVNHLDVYRLDHLSEVNDLDLPEVLDDDAVTLIEWGDAIVAALPADYLEVTIALGDGDDDRTFVVRVVGPSWAARRRGLERALGPWTGGG